MGCPPRRVSSQKSALIGTIATVVALVTLGVALRMACRKATVPAPDPEDEARWEDEGGAPIAADAPLPA